jgi:phosphatidylglycerophosphatase A
MTLNEKVILFFATGCFAGKIPYAPGTFGTFVAIPFVWVLTLMPPSLMAFYAICLILLAIYLSDRAEAILQKKDPGCIVIDEITGYVVAMTVVPISILSVLIGFVVFRFFDIIKLPPTKYFENNFTGGAGIVLDDIAAGILTAIVLRFLYSLGLF